MLAVASFQFSVTNKAVESKLTVQHLVSLSFPTWVNKVLHLLFVCSWDVLRLLAFAEM